MTPGEGADNEVVSRGKSDADKTDGRKEYSWAMHIKDVYNLSHSIMKDYTRGNKTYHRGQMKNLTHLYFGLLPLPPTRAAVIGVIIGYLLRIRCPPTESLVPGNTQPSNYMHMHEYVRYWSDHRLTHLLIE